MRAWPSSLRLGHRRPGPSCSLRPPSLRRPWRGQEPGALRPAAPSWMLQLSQGLEPSWEGGTGKRPLWASAVEVRPSCWSYKKAQGLSRVRTQGESPCSLDGHTHWSPTCRHLVLEAQLPKLQKLASVVSEHPACSDLSSGPLPTCPCMGVSPESGADRLQKVTAGHSAALQTAPAPDTLSPCNFQSRNRRVFARRQMGASWADA